jgi:hypothetical protein
MFTLSHACYACLTEELTQVSAMLPNEDEFVEIRALLAGPPLRNTRFKRRVGVLHSALANTCGSFLGVLLLAPCVLV